MYCPECGKQNLKNSSYCANCGAKLEDNQPGRIEEYSLLYRARLINYPKLISDLFQSFRQQCKEKMASVKKIPAFFMNFYKESFKPFMEIYGVYAIMGTVVAVIIVGGMITNSVMNDPRRVAKKYVDGICSENWNNVYDTIEFNVEDSRPSEKGFDKFCKEYFSEYKGMKNPTIKEEGKDYDRWGGKTSERMVKQVYSDVADNLNVMNLFVKKNTDNKDVLYYTVTYQIEGSPDEQHLEVVVRKQKNSQYGAYKVPIGNIVSSLTVVAPTDSTVTVDDSIPSDYPSDLENPDYKEYHFRNLYNGKHTIKITNKLYEDYNSEVYLYEPEKEISVFDNDLVLKDDIFGKLNTQSQTIVKKYYEGAEKKTAFNHLEVKFSSDQNALAETREDYETLAEYSNSADGTGMERYQIDNFTVDKNNCELISSQQYRCEFDFDYFCFVRYLNDENQIETEPSRTYSRHGEIMFVMENDEWVVSSIRFEDRW